MVATEALERRQDVRTLRFGERDLPRQRRRRTELQAGRHVRRQIIGLDGLAAAQDGGALDRILQLPDVAGPRIAQHAFQRGRREPQRAAQLRRRAREEVLGQRRNVLAAIAQRRQGHLDHVETVEEILAEAPLADPRREIAVGGGEHAHVDGGGLRRAEPSHLTALERPQQLLLQRGRHLRDLVQEQCPPAGLLEQSELAAGGAGECAPHVAEQLRLEQRLGHRAAVDRDERARRARARVVHRLGDHFLARPGFALDEDRGIGRRDTLHEIEHGLHGGGLRDEPGQPVALAQLRLEIGVLATQGA